MGANHRLPPPDLGFLPGRNGEQDWLGLRSLRLYEQLAESRVGLSRMIGDYYTVLFVKV